MARIATLTLRLAWSTHLTNVSLAIAASIFVQLGVLLLFIINILFTQRLIRASHSHFAWTKPFSIAFKVYYASIVVVVIILVTFTVMSFYTRNKHILLVARDVQRFGSTYFAVAAFLPLPMLLLRAILPRQNKMDRFGQGRMRTKVALIVFSSSILTLGAAFRAGVNFMPRPASNPAWYHSKACFYIFNFTIEWIVVALYVGIRVDKRFIIPNGAHGPGSYSGSVNDVNDEQKTEAYRINTEEEIFEGVQTSSEKNPDDLEAQLGGTVLTPTSNVNHELPPNADTHSSTDKLLETPTGTNVETSSQHVPEAQTNKVRTHETQTNGNAQTVNIATSAELTADKQEIQTNEAVVPPSKKVSENVSDNLGAQTSELVVKSTSKQG